MTGQKMERMSRIHVRFPLENQLVRAIEITERKKLYGRAFLVANVILSAPTTTQPLVKGTERFIDICYCYPGGEHV